MFAATTHVRSRRNFGVTSTSSSSELDRDLVRNWGRVGASRVSRSSPYLTEIVTIFAPSSNLSTRSMPWLTYAKTV